MPRQVQGYGCLGEGLLSVSVFVRSINSCSQREYHADCGFQLRLWKSLVIGLRFQVQFEGRILDFDLNSTFSEDDLDLKAPLKDFSQHS